MSGGEPLAHPSRRHSSFQGWRPFSAWKNPKGFTEEGRAEFSKEDKDGGKTRGEIGRWSQWVGECVAKNEKGVEGRQQFREICF